MKVSERASITFYLRSPWLLPPSSRPSPLISGLDAHHTSDRNDPMRAVCRDDRELSNAPRIAHRHASERACESIDYQPASIEHLQRTTVQLSVPVYAAHVPPNVKESAVRVTVACGGFELADMTSARQ